MHADTTELVVGQEVLVTVSAWVDDSIAGTDNGLDTWQMDVGVSQSGIVEITNDVNPNGDITLIAPNPAQTDSKWKYSTLNNPNIGAVEEVTVIQDVYGTPSLTGVGGYSEIFSFNIKALAVGTVTYDLYDNGMGFYAILVDDTEFENAGVSFDTDGSDNVFTVVPEPCTMLLLGLGCAVLRRRS
jgi:hypothetical protein